MLLTSKHAAIELDVSESALRNSRSTGFLFGEKPPTHIKIGTQVRYKKDDLRVWIENQQLQQKAEQV